MKETGIFTIVSPLHDAKAVEAMTSEYLSGLGIDYDFLGDDFSQYGSRPLDIIFVCTGGTEGVLLKLLPSLRAASSSPVYLLASDKNNSLPASMEILSYLRQNGIEGEIFHGEAKAVGKRIQARARAEVARRRLQSMKLGVIGQPSDWLISSKADYGIVKERLGIDITDIPMQELLDEISKTPVGVSSYDAPTEEIRRSLPGAEQIYAALAKIVERHGLQGFTLRCFDLLTTVKNTGCLALARLNSEGIVAGCEGDVPTMLSMTIAQAVTGKPAFQANPAYTKDDGHVLFAHCTIPFSLTERFELDTHFESGIGVGIRGYVKPGPVTIFKVAGDMSRYFIDLAELEECQGAPGLCRTQMLVKTSADQWKNYFANNPIGNHHVIIPGNHLDTINVLMRDVIGE